MDIFLKLIERNRKHIPNIQKALLETYFSDYDKDFLKTKEGILDIENNVFRRYNHSLKHSIPWLNRFAELKGKRVLEIGTGTGSSTAALAHFVENIQGYDIHKLALEGARRRLEILGLENTQLHEITESSLIPRIEQDASDKYDIILLFAVLEHQTIEERHNTLKTCWELLSDNGIMAVLDTPNILHFFDLHTSRLPFLHMLPTRVYGRYAPFSNRPPFADSFADEPNTSDGDLEVKIARWGRGVSYHDFELTLGKKYKNYLIAEGFEPEILSWFPPTPEEELLRWYLQHKEFDIPLGFSRCVLNLIFKKHSKQNSLKSGVQTDHTPPDYIHFTPLPESQHQLVNKLKDETRQKDEFIEKILSSRTWKIGNFIASHYRRFSRTFTK